METYRFGDMKHLLAHVERRGRRSGERERVEDICGKRAAFCLCNACNDCINSIDLCAKPFSIWTALAMIVFFVFCYSSPSSPFFYHRVSRVQNQAKRDLTLCVYKFHPVNSFHPYQSCVSLWSGLEEGGIRTHTHGANNTTYLVFLSCIFLSLHLPRLQHFSVFSDAVVIVLTYIYLYTIYQSSYIDIGFKHRSYSTHTIDTISVCVLYVGFVSSLSCSTLLYSRIEPIDSTHSTAIRSLANGSHCKIDRFNPMKLRNKIHVNSRPDATAE